MKVLNYFRKKLQLRCLKVLDTSLLMSQIKPVVFCFPCERWQLQNKWRYLLPILLMSNNFIDFINFVIKERNKIERLSNSWSCFALYRHYLFKIKRKATKATSSDIIKAPVSWIRTGIQSLVVSDLRSEAKGSQFKPGCYLCADVSSQQ